MIPIKHIERISSLESPMDISPRTVSPRILERQSCLKTTFELSNTHHGASIDQRNRAAELTSRLAERIFPFIVLGNEQIRSDVPLLKNLGIVSVNPCPTALALLEKHISKTTPPSDNLYTHGSILIDEQWNIVLNDALILKGVQDGIDFHIGLQGQIPTAANLWFEGKVDPTDPTKNEEPRIRVFARELAILRLAGYKYHEIKDQDGKVVQATFKKPAEKECSKITMNDCVQMLKDFKTKAHAEELIEMFKDPIIHEL